MSSYVYRGSWATRGVWVLARNASSFATAYSNGQYDNIPYAGEDGSDVALKAREAALFCLLLKDRPQGKVLP